MAEYFPLPNGRMLPGLPGVCRIQEGNHVYRLETIDDGDVHACFEETTGQRLTIKVENTKAFCGESGYRELSVLRKLRDNGAFHHNILRFFHSFLLDDYLVLITERLGWSLYELLRHHCGFGIPLEAVSQFSRGIFRALGKLKELGIVHGYIKLKNILMNSEGEAVLVDFSNAFSAGTIDYGDGVQVRRYRAPEVFIGAPLHSGVDVWSAGCVAVFLALGHKLFGTRSRHKHLAQMLHAFGDIPQRMLHAGHRTHDHFKLVHSRWELKSMEEFMATHVGVRRDDGDDRLLPEDPFTLNFLPEMLRQASEPPPTPEQTRGFLKFIERVLCVDPASRAAPWEAFSLCDGFC